MKHLVPILLFTLPSCSKPVSSTAAPGYGIETYSHDGHLFVIWNGYDAGGLIHHPGCPCLGKSVTPTPATPNDFPGHD